MLIQTVFGKYFELVLILVIAVMGAWAWCLLKNKKDCEKEILAIEKERDEYADLGKGLTEYNQKLQEKKNKAKETILELFKTKVRISNNDVVKILNISSASVRRYLDDLEVEGKIKQVGKTGQKVFYTVT